VNSLLSKFRKPRAVNSGLSRDSGLLRDPAPGNYPTKPPRAATSRRIPRCYPILAAPCEHKAEKHVGMREVQRPVTQVQAGWPTVQHTGTGAEGQGYGGICDQNRTVRKSFLVPECLGTPMLLRF